MILIFLIDANKNKILKAARLNAREVEFVKIDDKKLADYSFFLVKMRDKKYDNVFFACIDADYQRFKFFIKLYLALSGRTRGGIIDEQGRFIAFSWPKFVFFDIPAIIFEFFASALVIIYSYVKFPFIKWRLTRKK